MSALLFRVRYSLHFVLFLLGFTAPWNYLLHLDPRGPNAHVWGILAANLAMTGALSLLAAFNLLLSVAIALAFAGAALRTWGTAYLGAEVVKDSAMHQATGELGGILTDGPFRHLRNPLYVGTFLHTLALALLMPRSGAIFTIVAIGVLQLVLIRGEETFLARTLGAAYHAYTRLVPRLWPRLRAKIAPSNRVPRWRQAFPGEIYFWGVALSYAALGWRYNADLLIRCVLVSVGLSIVCRAFVPRAGADKATESEGPR